MSPFTREAQGDECHRPPGWREELGWNHPCTLPPPMWPAGCLTNAAFPSLTLSPQTVVAVLGGSILGASFWDPPKLLDLDPPQDRTDLLPFLGRFRSWPELCQSGLPRGHFAQYTDGALGLPIAFGQVTPTFNRALWLRLPRKEGWGRKSENLWPGCWEPEAAWERHGGRTGWWSVLVYCTVAQSRLECR